MAITANGAHVSPRASLVKSLVKEAKDHWGAGWSNLTEHMREAEVALRVLTVLTGQDQEAYDKSPSLARIAALAEACLEEVRNS